MKRFNLIQFLFVFLFSLPISAQEYGFNFNPKDDYQFKAVSSDGEIYAVKMSKTKAQVEETMLIDLKNDKSMVTYYDDAGFPTETIDKDKYYTYATNDNKTTIISSEAYENIKAQKQSDADVLKSRGINLSFTDEYITENEDWLDGLSKTKKKVDMIFERVAYLETAKSCGFAMFGDITEAAPCVSGLINVVGVCYNETDPELSKSLSFMSSGVEMMNNYIVNGEIPITTWDAVKYAIDKTDEYYNERKAVIHQCADLIRQDIKEEAVLLSEQSLEGEGDVDSTVINATGGIIQIASKKIIELNKKTDAAKDELREIYKKGDQAALDKATANINQMGEEIKKIRKDAETAFNDSVKDKIISVSWRKKDSNPYYKVKNVYFTGVKWDYGVLPHALLDFNIKFSPKNVREISGSEVSTHQANIRHLGFAAKSVKDKKDQKFRLIVNEDMRTNEKIKTSLDWEDLFVTPYVVFDQSEFN